MPYTSALLQTITTEQYEGRQSVDTGQVTIETHNNIFAEQFETTTNGVIVQPTLTNEKRSYIFESISGNTDSFTVSLQNLDEDGIRWTFDTTKAFILPEQARGNGKGLQGLSSVDDIRLIVNGSEFESAIIHGGGGNTGKGKGQGVDTNSKGKFSLSQLSSPDSTISNTSVDVVGSFTAHNSVNDLSDSSDGDESYISLNSISDSITLGLETVADPIVGNGHKLQITSRTENAGGQVEKLELQILQDGVFVCDFADFNIGSTYNTDEKTCTQTEGDTITDYSKLEVKIFVNQLGVGEEIRVSKVFFDVPKDPSVEPYGEFTYNGTHNLIELNLSKSLTIFFNDPTGATLRDIVFNATGLDQVADSIGDDFPNTYSIIQIETFLTSLEHYSPSSIRVDLIRDDFVDNKLTFAEVLFKMDSGEYGLDQGISDSSRVISDKYIQVSNINTFVNEIVDTVKADTELDRIED